MKKRNFDWLEEVFRLQQTHQESCSKIARLHNELDTALQSLHKVLDDYENGDCEPSTLLHAVAKTLSLSEESLDAHRQQLQQVQSFLQRVPFDLGEFGSAQALPSVDTHLYESRLQFDA